MTVTISLGSWVWTLVASVIGTALTLWWADKNCGKYMDFFSPLIALLFLSLSWGLPWGLYGVLRAIFN